MLPPVDTISAELEVAELKMLRFVLGVTKTDRISDRQLRLDGLEAKPERRDCVGLDTYRGEKLGMLGEGC